MQGVIQGWILITDLTGEGSASKFSQVVGRINFLAVVGCKMAGFKAITQRERAGREILARWVLQSYVITYI